MMRAVDLTGQKFGRLTAVERSGSKGGKARWRCVCDCTREHFASSASLKTGRVRSCGCLAAEVDARRRFKPRRGRIVMNSGLMGGGG